MNIISTAHKLTHATTMPKTLNFLSLFKRFYASFTNSTFPEIITNPITSFYFNP